jgi:hypothetical protein
MPQKTSANLTTQNSDRTLRLQELGFYNSQNEAINDAVRRGLLVIESEQGIEPNYKGE